MRHIILVYVYTHMTPEKIEEIESNVKFKLWLRRVGFKWYTEYIDYVNQWLINRIETILYYLRLQDEKDEKWRTLDDIVNNLPPLSK